MKIWVLACVTLLNLLHNKLIILFLAALLCIVLLMMAPLAGLQTVKAGNPEQAQAVALSLLSGITFIVSGFGSLLAAWAAADAVASEIRAGTILAVLARPVRRWELLIGKYVGVQILMAIYVVFMFATIHLLAWISGQHLTTNPALLVFYPMVRYGVYSAIAIWLVTVMHPVLAFALVLFTSALAGMLSPSAAGLSFLPRWISQFLFIVLPSVNLLSEHQFLTMTATAPSKSPYWLQFKSTLWTDHVTALAYGLDYSAVCLLMASWAFRRRNLTRE